MDSLSFYRPPNRSGGEQGYLSWFFGRQRESIQQLDLSFNYQLHQLSLSALFDKFDGRWLSLARRPAEINLYHFSAIPKPVHVMTCSVDEKSMGHIAPIWRDREGMVPFLNNELVPFSERGRTYCDLLWEHHYDRARASVVSEEELASHENQDLLRAVQHQAHIAWYAAWNHAWQRCP